MPSPTHPREAHDTAESTTHGRGRILRIRDFRLLLAGSTTSMLGDQFALIATPWLALELRNDPFILGIVLALEGAPRALSMLAGGVLTDRFTPRIVMLLTDVGRGAMTMVMAVIVLSGAAQIWMLLVFALCFGILSGVALPAQNTMVPSIVERDDLQAGNAVIMGAGQCTAFVGPTLAGAAIALSTSSTTGVGLAFMVNAATFVVSAMTFALMDRRTAPGRDPIAGHPLAAVRAGFVELWSRPALRFVFTVLAAVNLFAVGPLLVGIPLIAHQRLGGAMAFGVSMAAFAVGNLGGYVLAGVTRTPSVVSMARIVVVVLAAHGVVIALLASVGQLLTLATLLLCLGLGNGYLAIALFSWIQATTSERFLGRTMSLITFASLGAVSISQAAAGALGASSLDALFVSSGALVLATTAWAANAAGLRAFTSSLTNARPIRRPQEKQ